MRAAFPPNETERLATLYSLNILDTAPEAAFDYFVPVGSEGQVVIKCRIPLDHQVLEVFVNGASVIAEDTQTNKMEQPIVIVVPCFFRSGLNRIVVRGTRYTVDGNGRQLIALIESIDFTPKVQGGHFTSRAIDNWNVTLQRIDQLAKDFELLESRITHSRFVKLWRKVVQWRLKLRL